MTQINRINNFIKNNSEYQIKTVNFDKHFIQKMLGQE